MSNSLPQSLIFGKYRILQLLGKGSSSTVYMGKNLNLGENVAIKVEEWEKQGNLLESEAYYLFQLKGIGVPEVKSFGRHGKYKILILTLLGNSIDKYFKIMNNNFSIKDICMIAIQLIERLEYIHSKDIIHRDIKPGNFLDDLKTKRLLYLIDFGLAKKFRNSKTGKHIKFSIPKRLTGTARFASTNALRGAEQSRRDDLESAGYFLIYLAKKGFLPWQNIKIIDKMERYKQTYLLKKNIEPEKLCAQLPNEFSQYIKYVRELNFEEDPNYNYMKGLFINVLDKLGFKNDLFFSWLVNDKKNIDPNILKANEYKKKRVSPQEKIIKKIGEANKGKEKEKYIINDNNTSNSKFETTKENLETQIFNFNSSSNSVEKQLSNLEPKIDKQILTKNFSENKNNNIFKYNSKLSNINGKAIIDNKKEVNNGIESQPISFDPANYTFGDSSSRLETKGKIIPKNINKINRLCNQLLLLNKNINLTKNENTPISSPNHNKLFSGKTIKYIKIKNKNKFVNKTDINKKLSKGLTPSLSKEQKYIKNYKGNSSEDNTKKNSPEKREKDRQNQNNESIYNQSNDSFFKFNSIRKNYVSNSEVTNFTLNKNIDYNSKKILILNVDNSRKKSRIKNGLSINNNSIGNKSNLNSLRNSKTNNLLNSEISSNSRSSALDHSISFKNNTNNFLYSNNLKKESIKNYLDKNSEIKNEIFNYQTPKIIQDLKKIENKKPNNFNKNNLNKNNNNTNINNKHLCNYSNIDPKIRNYSSKEKGNLNLYQYNNYFIKYNINCNKDNQINSPDLSNNNNNKQSTIPKSSNINKCNDYKLFKRINENNNIINNVII